MECLKGRSTLQFAKGRGASRLHAHAERGNDQRWRLFSGELQHHAVAVSLPRINCSGTDHVSEGFLSVVCLIRKLELFVDRPVFLNL